jgi:hypothetical protein
MRTGDTNQTYAPVNFRSHSRQLLHDLTRAVSLFALILAATIAGCVEASAQPGTHRQYEIASIAIEGNASFTTSELRALMTTRETPGWFNKFLYSTISERLGRKNEYFNAVAFFGDAERLKRFTKLGILHGAGGRRCTFPG